MNKVQVFDGLRVGRLFYLTEVDPDMKKTGLPRKAVLIKKEMMNVVALLMSSKYLCLFDIGEELVDGVSMITFIGVSVEDAMAEYGCDRVIEGRELCDRWAGACLTFLDDVHMMAAIMEEAE